MSAVAQGDDPTQDLLTTGRRSFDDLNYHAADSIARLTLGLPGLRRNQRLQALQLAAASRFPAGEREQFGDSAMAALRALVRVAPTAPLPRTMTWRGLDSLLAFARRTTFGANASVPDSAVISGVSGTLTFEAFATRPAAFTLRVVRAGDPSIGELVDSVGPTERGTLRFAPVVTDQPHYASGAYRVVITAIEPESGDRILLSYRMTLQTPPVQLQSVPQALDATTLRPERTAPARARSVISGIVIGGFVYASVRAYRSPSLKDANVKPDSRASGWGVGLGILTTALSWYLDRGRVIVPNAAANDAARKAWVIQRDNLVASNANARVAYRGLAYFAQEEQ
ncbi:MAG: hypothetical protein V4558_03340 [Gemmatimonadota bacterium]